MLFESARTETTNGFRSNTVTSIFRLDFFKKALLVVGDIFVFYFSLALALTVRFQSFPQYRVWMAHLAPFSLLFGGWLLVFYCSDFYEIAKSKNDIDFYNQMAQVLWLNSGLTIGFFYLASPRLFTVKPQTVFFLFALIVSGLLLLWRYQYNRLIVQPALQRNVLVIGLNEGAASLIEEISRKPHLGYRIAALVHDKKEDLNLPGLRIYDQSTNIRQLLENGDIGTVVTAFDPRSNERLLQQLFSSLSLKLQFYELPTFYEKLTGKIPITAIGHVWFLENIARGDKSPYEATKRLWDILVALILLLLTLPFLPFVMLAIKLDSKGPCLFFQTRVGLLGRQFRTIKFRTMTVEAESDGVARWAKANDPRVTRVGRFLRKSRIDEIPQLWNVLRSEMSIIGPRPERPEFVSQLEQDIPFYNERHLVKPGLTGWAQIRFRYGASVADSFRKLEYDFFYIKNRSIPLDMAILLKTVSIVLRAGGQ
jgi:exopolysaccharide biosynthesis polyprenyl glycosylphosphotransferase